jgi:3-methyladenine DNA glycosylase AlkD
MEYSALLEELNSLTEEEYAAFQRKIVASKGQKILGVRTPVLRRLVKKYRSEYKTLMTFPDEYYEVTFLKLNAVALLPYEEFIKYVEPCVNCIENWATCDTFKANCLKTHREEFIPYLYKFLQGGEFARRYALNTLLYFYIEEKYLPLVFKLLTSCDLAPYYTHMAAAWLTAEVLIKYYPQGLEFLKEGKLPPKTHNKAIQKARESFRLSDERKEELHKLHK